MTLHSLPSASTSSTDGQNTCDTIQLRHFWPNRDVLLEHNILMKKGQTTLLILIVPIAKRSTSWKSCSRRSIGSTKMMYSSKQNF